MRLIIAEKHSVAQAIASAIGGNRTQGDGYIRCGDSTLVTWAQGHLVELLTPAEYENRNWKQWSMESLPLDPTPDWRWKVSTDRGADRQYRNIASLLNRSDVDVLVNACDPDREGESIFRRIVAHARCRKPAWRLWVASLEEDAIRQALDSMRPESEYDGLAAAAEIRAKADWLIGMNASRAYSLAYDRRFAVGRVQTPTLAMVVDRDLQIGHHRPVPFWKVDADMGGWRLTSERFDRREDAEHFRMLAAADGEGFDILESDRRIQHERPPHLYDLTSLQKDMSRMHGLTAARTLAALQHLYEMRLATYPRTDSQYVTSDDLASLRRLAEGGTLVDGFAEPKSIPVEPRFDLVVDDAKVAGHTAILPTMQAGADCLAPLTDDERLVLVRIVRRMWEAMSEDCLHEVATVRARLRMDDGVEFSCRSDVVTSRGWRAVENEKASQTDDDDAEPDGPRNVIPVNLLAPCTLIPVSDATITQGETKPPKPFTDSTLLAAMEHASRYVDDKTLKEALDDDESHSGGLGTPATRADIIEKLVRSKYLERKGKQLRSTSEGRDLVMVVDGSRKDVATTARMERDLAMVERGLMDPSEVMEAFRADARGIPTQAMQSAERNPELRKRKTEDESFGPCPRCGAAVVRTGTVWQCSTNKREKQPDGGWKDTAGCGWKLFASISGKKLTDTNVRNLLAGKRVHLKGFTSKAGKKFDADIVADKDKGTRFDFGR
ncbi:DNA topoisomerase III [Bifidobacterium lemurum]|uniref:DNA topoisomerase n=1 Tax=Bifidobacterium lemurum TaxID=1603886 RepID=A0A261FM54_9BIFI|nr:type IA DNA topoisomerase [Bifidobacterium lemurum]OZG59896.1 DNA topoisomerase III [Bifidobacterium lemurum]QOL33922.1 topoisomerase C-terminal repeat-containing protein [Bifidobacterium lemurum]